MSEPFFVVAPVVTGPTRTVTAPVIAPAEAPGATLATPAPEQVEAAEAAFRQEVPGQDISGQNDEARLVSGVLGMWAGTLLLHDLALEHFSVPPEERPRRSGRPRDEGTDEGTDGGDDHPGE